MGVGRGVSITAHHANVKESRFDVDFFAGFDLVLNGLDNLEVRGSGLCNATPAAGVCTLDALA